MNYEISEYKFSSLIDMFAWRNGENRGLKARWKSKTKPLSWGWLLKVKSWSFLFGFQSLGFATVNYDQSLGDCEDRGNKKKILNNIIETLKRTGKKFLEKFCSDFDYILKNLWKILKCCRKTCKNLIFSSFRKVRRNLKQTRT